MKHLKPLIENIFTKIREYKTQPSANRIFVLHGSPLSGKTYIAKEIAKRLDGEYVDLLKDKLGVLNPKLGLYTPLDFKKDISTWAKKTASVLILDEIETLLDTWTRQQQENLLKLLSGLGGRMPNPVLIVSRLDLPYEDFMGKEKIFTVP
jgi:replication-associated recombination protein RarA